MIVGVLGGTFDPPHLGHLAVARNVLKSGLVATVWFIPCLAHRFGKQPTGFEHRIAMCQLLVRDEEGMAVSNVEASLENPGRTLDLIVTLQAIHHTDSFRLVAGSDIYHERHHWHRYDEIEKLAPPIYVERKGIERIPISTLAAPPEISSSDLRTALARGERPTNEITQDVLDYIETHGLYREMQ